ncbi:hypothetical protein LCGC14_0231200 [marine sediment metagenome]|uniref:Uncharacterized protein n=1 Tax=marine sediment metagenome TaxID=412755 RepID=A0A0F9XE11_9ZZZZ
MAATPSQTENPTPCVRCGYCCKQTPCMFGQWDSVRGQCIYLEEDQSRGRIKTYKCSKYGEIKNKKGAWSNPAFGYGCSSPLGNTARSQIINSRLDFLSFHSMGLVNPMGLRLGHQGKLK